MSTTPVPPPGDSADPVVGVGSAVDSGRLLDELVVQRRPADEAEANLLALAVCYAEQHPVTRGCPDAGGDQNLAPFDPATGELLDADAGRGSPVAGVGTPAVAEAAVVELGAALGVSYGAALNLVSEAVELAVRLPKLWDLVHAGHLQAWRARHVARHTVGLSAPEAGFVDQHASVPGRRNRLPQSLTGLVHEALVRCHPEIADGVESRLLARDVCFDYASGDSTATSRMWATLDTLDALDLDHTLAQMATRMATLGDSSSLGVRRAHALGMLASRQRHLDVFDLRPTDVTDGDAVGAGLDGVGQAEQRPSKTAATLYLHVTAEDLRSWGERGAGVATGVGRVERLGSGTLDLLRDWLQRTSRVTVRPVLDPTRADAVDRHDPPEPMREAVILRDGHCVYPGCGIRRPVLRRGPHHSLRPDRRRRSTRADQRREPRLPVPATPPTQDLHRLAIPPDHHRTRPRRGELPVDQSRRDQLPGTSHPETVSTRERRRVDPDVTSTTS